LPASTVTDVPAAPRRFDRYVAIGDSSTEGLDDPDGLGGYRGWADRLAGHLARAQGELAYANLAVRGRRTRQVREQQLEAALALRPDLVTLFSGTNDVLARRFDPDALAGDVEAMHRPLIAGGAVLLTFTLPDLSSVIPLARLARARIEALNEQLRAVSQSTGAILLDFARIPVTGDPRLWSEDRLHANAEGHTRIAAALATALGLPGIDPGWHQPLEGPKRLGLAARSRAELAWIGGYFLPWAWRHLRGRSSGDGVGPKRPALEPFLLRELAPAEPPSGRKPGGGLNTPATPAS